MTRSQTSPHGIGSMIVRLNQEFQEKYGKVIYNEQGGQQANYALYELQSDTVVSGYGTSEVLTDFSLVEGGAVDPLENGVIQLDAIQQLEATIDYTLTFDDTTFDTANFVVGWYHNGNQSDYYDQVGDNNRASSPASYQSFTQMTTEAREGENELVDRVITPSDVPTITAHNMADGSDTTVADEFTVKAGTQFGYLSIARF